MMNSEYQINNKNKIFLISKNIKNIHTINILSNKHQQHPLQRWDGIITEAPDLTEINKQIFFPLTHLHKYRKESLINNQSTAYLNSVHPTKLRVNLNNPHSKKQRDLRGLKNIRVAPSNRSDVIYEYLKTFSKYSNKKKGVLINFNQHIAYNFNSKNLLVRAAKAVNNNSLQIKTNKNKSTNAVPLTFSLQLEKASVHHSGLVSEGALEKAKTTKNINKNLNINYPLNKPLLGLYPVSTKNTPKASFENTHTPLLRKEMKTQMAEEPYDSTSVDREISKNLLLRQKLKLNIINRQTGVSVETGYNLKVNNNLIKYSYKLLFNFFKSMYCLISKPVFIFTPDKVVIQIHYFLCIPKYKVFKWYSIFKSKKKRQKREARIKQKNNKRFNWYAPKKRKQKLKGKIAKTLIRFNNKRTKVKNILFNLNKYNLFKVFSLKFKLICEILNNKFNKPVELQLIRLHQPYLDSNIFVNLLSLNIRNKKKKIFKTNVKIIKLFQKRLVKNVGDPQNKSVNLIPTYLSGLKIRIGGRLIREKVIPRISKKIYERGASSIGKVNFLDTSSITKKNRKGSYTLKISLGQNFF